MTRNLSQPSAQLHGKSYTLREAASVNAITLREGGVTLKGITCRLIYRLFWRYRFDSFTASQWRTAQWNSGRADPSSLPDWARIL
jgi:hypothetical protein